MDFGKETAIPHVSPCFFACCLLKQLSYQLQPPTTTPFRYNSKASYL